MDVEQAIVELTKDVSQLRTIQRALLWLTSATLTTFGGLAAVVVRKSLETILAGGS